MREQEVVSEREGARCLDGYTFNPSDVHAIHGPCTEHAWMARMGVCDDVCLCWDEFNGWFVNLKWMCSDNFYIVLWFP